MAHSYSSFAADEQHSVKALVKAIQRHLLEVMVAERD